MVMYAGLCTVGVQATLFARQQYYRGKTARSIAKWQFKELLNDNYEDLKKIIFRQSVDNNALLQKIEAFERA